MKDQIFTILGIIIIVCIIYFISAKWKNYKEGFTDSSYNSNSNSNYSGDAGNASTYASLVKSNTVKLQDSLLLNKYRNDYENIILNMDDLVNNMMLQTVLNINTSNSDAAYNSLEKLNVLHSAKASLNSVMKFIDGN
jgi:hypothetical protein